MKDSLMEDKLLKIINRYGVNHQQRKLQEEVFELNEAIIDYEIYCHSALPSLATEEEKKMHIAEELADVMVMLCQFKEHYKIDGNEIIRIMDEKIDRQLKRMEEGKND